MTQDVRREDLSPARDTKEEKKAAEPTPDNTSHVIDVDDQMVSTHNSICFSYRFIQETDDEAVDPWSSFSWPDYDADKYEERPRVITRSMMKKDQEQEKTPGFFKGVADWFMGNIKPKEESMDVEPDEPVTEEREVVSEVQFVSLLEACSDEEIVVR